VVSGKILEVLSCLSAQSDGTLPKPCYYVHLTQYGGSL
jgi:hypothetical protein